MKVAVVGDIHGDAARLSSALSYLDTLPGEVVFVGDYVNRGPDSHGVIEQLLAFQNRHGGRAIFLRGNHEQALLDYLDTGNLSDLAAHGGLITINSYRQSSTSSSPERFRARFPSSHRNFIESTAHYFEGPDLLVSHSGFNPLEPDSRSPENMHERSFPDLFTRSGPWPHGTVVCGHYLQTSGLVHFSDHLVCIDTGCGTVPQGKLSILLLPDRTVVTF